VLHAAITDYTFPDLSIEREVLEPQGVALQAGQCRGPAETAQLVRDADVVLTQFAPVDRSVIAAMQRARVIVRYGIGVDNVDLDAAREAGIPVCNVPDYCIDEVADHALALILAATRQVVANANHVGAGHWGLATPLSAMRCLKNQTVGIVGLGRIGREVASRLRPFKCALLGYDPVLAPADAAACGITLVGWDELLAGSDIVTLHCPATAATRGLINAEAIDRLRRGAVLVNVARGAIVDTAALLSGLERGAVGFAALDVLEQEPMPPDHPLGRCPQAIVHSHIASASPEAVANLRRQAATIAGLAVQRQPLPNIVNGLGPSDYQRRLADA